MATPVGLLPSMVVALSEDDATQRKAAPAEPGGVASPSGLGGAHISSAWFSPGSPDYRYLLTRRWGPGPVMTWIMLNPSRADGMVDDPTIRRCVRFARAAGCTAIAVTNLYAWRTPDPRELRRVTDPVGPDNDAWIRAAAEAAACGPVVAAWGARAEPARALAVLKLLADCFLQPLQCLGTTAAGHPRHPLYLPTRTRLQPLSSTSAFSRTEVLPHEWGPWAVVSTWDGDEEVVERCCLICGADELTTTDRQHVEAIAHGRDAKPCCERPRSKTRPHGGPPCHAASFPHQQERSDER